MDDSGNGRLLARLDERTKRIEDKLDGYCTQTEKRHDDHEQRLRDLEAARPGLFVRDIGGVVGGVVAGIVAGLSAAQK